MPLPDRAASQAIPHAGLSGATFSAAVLRAVAPVQPLLAPFAACWLIYVALAVLLQSRALRVFSAGLLPSVDVLRHASYALTPDVLLTGSRDSASGVVVLSIYAVLACLALASWCWAHRMARPLELHSAAPLLAMAALLGVPLLAAPGLFSDDVYLYDLYGRTLHLYGSNPISMPPSDFPYDSHLQWVYWRDLPAAYGPVWLMLSSVLSGLAGDSITATVTTYRVAALGLHLLTAAAVWRLLRRSRPAYAAAGTIFYAWNPMVLIEVVGNAHNDVLVACFAVLMVAAAAQRAWSSAAFFGACAVMVKPFAVLLIPPLAVGIVQDARAGSRVRLLLRTTVVWAGTVLLLYLPLWAGTRLLENINENPASHIYTNTIWELISEAGPAWFGVTTLAIQHPYLDALREACFLLGAFWILTRPSSRRAVPRAALRLWLLFCLTACWVWPWYFVPLIALAAINAGGGTAAAMALTAGGLLFWTTWPAPAVEGSSWLYTWRSVVLFGPVLLTIASATARAACLTALGLRAWPEPVPADDTAGVKGLQTSEG